MSLLATVTFLGERADITGPDRRMLVSGRRRNADVLFATSQSTTTSRITPTKSPAGPWCLQLCPAGNSPIWQPGGGATTALKRLGQANRRVRRVIGTRRSARMGESRGRPTRSVHSPSHARVGESSRIPDTVRAISAGPAPGAPSLGAPSPADPPPERPFPGRRPARSRCRARAGSGWTRPPHR